MDAPVDLPPGSSTEVTYEQVEVAPFGRHEDLSPWEWSIVLGGLKGGLGKTTSTWLLALALARRTQDPVVAVDADPKSQTLADSYRTAVSLGLHVPFHLLVWPQSDGLVKGVRAEMEKVGARHVLLDCGGDDEKILEQACLIGTDLIIPVAATKPDMRRIPATLGVAARVGSLNSELAANVLFTSVDKRSRDEKQMREWAEAPDRDYPMFKTSISDTVAYKRALYDVPESVGLYDFVLDEMARDRAAA